MSGANFEEEDDETNWGQQLLTLENSAAESSSQEVDWWDPKPREHAGLVF